MKQTWNVDELIDRWTLIPDELALVNKSKTRSVGKACASHNRLGFAINLKYFQVDGKFPRHQHDVPGTVADHIGKQLGVPLSAYADYNWQGRTIKNHRADIRKFLGFRVGTADDGHNVMAWLTERVFPHNHRLEHLKEAAYQRYRELKIEPPAKKHLERLIRSALHTYTEHFCADIFQRIPPATRAKLDAILSTSVEMTAADDELAGFSAESETGEASASRKSPPKRSVFFELKKGPGSINHKSILAEVDKLQHIHQLELPGALFQHVSPNVLKQYRQRIASEGPREVRRHPEPKSAGKAYTFFAIRSLQSTAGSVVRR